MAAEGMQFSWRWNGGTISTNLDGVWGMSGHMTIQGRVGVMADQWIFKSETYDNCNCAINCGCQFNLG